MTHGEVSIHQLENRGDHRGDAFPIPEHVLRFLGRVAEAHVVTIRPGMVRGNHYHANRDELMVIMYSGGWRLAWQHAPNDGIQTRDFEGRGSVAVCIPAGVTHAVKNTGGRDVTLSSFSNDDSDDVTKRILLE